MCCRHIYLLLHDWRLTTNDTYQHRMYSCLVQLKYLSNKLHLQQRSRYTMIEQQVHMQTCCFENVSKIRLDGSGVYLSSYVHRSFLDLDMQLLVQGRNELTCRVPMQDLSVLHRCKKITICFIRSYFTFLSCFNKKKKQPRF